MGPLTLMPESAVAVQLERADHVQRGVEVELFAEVDGLRRVGRAGVDDAEEGAAAQVEGGAIALEVGRIAPV